jgi:hypothetical protein
VAPARIDLDRVILLAGFIHDSSNRPRVCLHSFRRILFAT